MTRLQNGIPIPTREEICKAREIFGEKEPRELFYRVATEIMGLVLQPPPSQPQPLFSETEALAVLLQTWNKRHYNKNHPFDSEHLFKLEQVVTANKPALISFRARSIATFSDNDKATIQKIFESFDAVIGPVGTGKSLHLFAPDFFPIWDSIIAREYDLSLMYGKKDETSASNANKYIKFMGKTKAQYDALAQKQIDGNLLKRIDEYNYCKFSRRWMQ